MLRTISLVVIASIAAAVDAGQPPQKPAPSDTPLKVAAAHRPIRDSWKDVQKELDRIREEEHAAERRLVADWIQREEIKPLPVPELGRDPRKSEIDAHDRAVWINSFIKQIPESYGSLDQLFHSSDAVVQKKIDLYDEATGRKGSGP